MVRKNTATSPTATKTPTLAPPSTAQQPVEVYERMHRACPCVHAFSVSDEYGAALSDVLHGLPEPVVHQQASPLQLYRVVVLPLATKDLIEINRGRTRSSISAVLAVDGVV